MSKGSLYRAAIVCLFCLLQITPMVFADDLYSYSDENGMKYYTNERCTGCMKVKFPLIKGSVRSSDNVPWENSKTSGYDCLIAEAGKTYAVDPDLVRAVIKVESNFNPRAVSPKGARGLMQLMPQTARDLGVADVFDPALNIRGGVTYLSRLLSALEGNLPLSLAAYNAGLERVAAKKEIPAIRETRDYVEKVMNCYARLKSR